MRQDRGDARGPWTEQWRCRQRSSLPQHIEASWSGQQCLKRANADRGGGSLPHGDAAERGDVVGHPGHGMSFSRSSGGGGLGRGVALWLAAGCAFSPNSFATL